MGYDLMGSQGYFGWNMWAWREILNLARKYGWDPKGTDAPSIEGMEVSEEEWSGTYFSNDYQRVSEEDAKGIADAIERALPDIPHATWTGQQVRASAVARRRRNILESWEGSHASLREFIEYCRGGGFTIG